MGNGAAGCLTGRVGKKHTLEEHCWPRVRQAVTICAQVATMDKLEVDTMAGVVQHAHSTARASEVGCQQQLQHSVSLGILVRDDLKVEVTSPTNGSSSSSRGGIRTATKDVKRCY